MYMYVCMFALASDICRINKMIINLSFSTFRLIIFPFNSITTSTSRSSFFEISAYFFLYNDMLNIFSTFPTL